ncbi:MAG: hypothetical protein ACKO0V_17095 [bacterium]
MSPAHGQLESRPSRRFRAGSVADSAQKSQARQFLSRRHLILGGGLSAGVTTAVVQYWDEVFLKRFAEVVPGQVFRAAWQQPWPIRRLVETCQIKSILSLSVMGTADPKFINYASVVQPRGIEWVILPIRGSYMSLAQMAEAADFIENLPRPLLFHCVAGHHRSTQAQAAWRIRHQGYSAKAAWAEVSQYRWTNPTGDSRDHSLVDRFAASAYLEKDYLYEPTAYDAMAGQGRPRLASA